MHSANQWTSVSSLPSTVIVEGRCDSSVLGMLLKLAMSGRDRGRLEISTPDSTFRFRFHDQLIISASEDPPNPCRRLGDLLVESGRLTEEAVQRALDIQLEEGGRLGQVLVNQQAVDEAELAAALRSQALRRIEAALLGDQVDYRVLEDSGMAGSDDQPLGVRVEQLLGG